MISQQRSGRARRHTIRVLFTAFCINIQWLIIADSMTKKEVLLYCYRECKKCHRYVTQNLKNPNNCWLSQREILLHAGGLK